MPAGHARSPFTQYRVHSLRQLVNERQCIGGAGGGPHFSQGRRAAGAVGDVIAHAVGKQDHVLTDQCDVGAQARQCDRVQIHAVDQDLPGTPRIKAGQQVCQRGLAATGSADDGDHLARGDM
ncbi:MAG: hypothetical protein A3H91_03195 [Gammaproteobacteria bacterium RIFCSPLOWO2_02_FULL_61_13]|nr:MAG: hypothetical protein A3H91_03195 [Gammaproteobacteria bacterium RIFCSPLOWO2_02_FULL_61_13]